MTVIIETSRKIQSVPDMIPVTAWLKDNVSEDSWKWEVSKEWIKGWGHPMLVIFEDNIGKDVITLFRLKFGR